MFSAEQTEKKMYSAFPNVNYNFEMISTLRTGILLRQRKLSIVSPHQNQVRRRIFDLKII